MNITLCAEDSYKLQVLQKAARSVFGESEITYSSAPVARNPKEPFGEAEHTQYLMAAIDEAKKHFSESDLYVCMLGGMSERSDGLYETAGVLVVSADNTHHFSSCASFKLPQSVANAVRNGTSFSTAIQPLFDESNAREDGFISLLTNGAITKKDQYLQTSIIALSEYAKRDSLYR